MIPIHELLNRIRRDPEFAKGNFDLGIANIGDWSRCDRLAKSANHIVGLVSPDKPLSFSRLACVRGQVWVVAFAFRA